jgi:hypothetical protein
MTRWEREGLVTKSDVGFVVSAVEALTGVRDAPD